MELYTLDTTLQHAAAAEQQATVRGIDCKAAGDTRMWLRWEGTVRVFVWRMCRLCGVRARLAYVRSDPDGAPQRDPVVRPGVCLFVCVCVCVCLFVCLFGCLFVCLVVCLCACVIFCMFVCLFLHVCNVLALVLLTQASKQRDS